MKKTIIIALLCVGILLMSGCNMKYAADALKKTMDTMNNSEETTTPPQEIGSTVSGNITQTIRSDNKTVTGDATAWIDIYGEKLYPNSYKEIQTMNTTPIAEFTYMSDEFNVGVTEIEVVFSDSVSDKVMVVDTDSDYLVDIINKTNLPKMFDNYYVYEMLKADTRFADKLVANIGNKYPTNAVEVDFTVLVEQPGSDYNLLSTKMINNLTLEIIYKDNAENIAKYEFDYLTGVIKTTDNAPPDYLNNAEITTINSPDGKHTAFIDEETKNLYVTDSATGDKWLIFEAVISPKEMASINYVYNNKLVYSILGIDSATGFGIYDFKNNSNTIYLDNVDVAGIQNGILFLNGYNRTPANPSFTIDLNTDDYKITDITDIFKQDIYFSESGTNYATVNAYTGETRITVYNTSDNRIKSEHVITLNSARVFDIKMTADNLILICRKGLMEHDYIYVFKLS